MRELRPFGWFVIVGLISLSPSLSVAQSAFQKTSLASFAQQKRSEATARKAKAIEFAAVHHIPVTLSDNNSYSELISIGNNNVPQYYTTHNKNAAATISTDKLFNATLSPFSLNGAGMTIYEWDGGVPLTTHNEFGGRITIGDAGNTAFHATHIAGTLIASGVDAKAKGMSPDASLVAYEWNNDVAEMAEAAANGALLSNHSYGYLRGWSYNGASWTWFGDSTISNQEDYLFGFYDEQAHDWDQVASDAPYYLIVKSAGNERNEGPVNGQRPKDGPYDCLSNAAVAKNVLTVGAVDALPGGYTQPGDVRMSPFSSFGPTDDGRIKPDIVADGIGIYSTDDDSNSDYITLSGTSMSTASVTGSLCLLQELHHILFNSYMKAATLKGLVITTANETGATPGPDYQYGWGLMNTFGAASLIAKNAESRVMMESSLAPDSVITQKITCKGDEPLKVTLSWTDLPGTSPEPSLDPETAMLVNDLDITITRDGIDYYPWKLDPSMPSAPATANGRNHADNVEEVFIQAPGAGEYTVTISHTGILAGKQDFSLIVSGGILGSKDNGALATDDEREQPMKGLKIYPNPAKDAATFESEGINNGNLDIYDLSGRQVLELALTSDKSVVNLSSLKAGQYISIIDSEGIKRVGTLIKL